MSRRGRRLPFTGVGAFAGLPADEYALHSLRMGGATFLSAGGASVDVVRKKGRWKLDAYMGYVRSHGEDAKVVSDMLADADARPALQSGQRIIETQR